MGKLEKLFSSYEISDLSCYTNNLKRINRYLEMFSNVGGSVRLGNRRVVFQDEIDWAIKFLRKDDRIVWYLSILQKITFKVLESKNRYQSKKWKANARSKM